MSDRHVDRPSSIACAGDARSRAGACRSGLRARRRAKDRRGGAAANRLEVAAVRRPAASARQQRQGRGQAMDLHAAGVARAEQGGAAIRRAGRGERRGAAHRESSRSRVRSVDVDAGAAARAAHRAAGSVDPVFRHRLQLRRPRRARRQSVQLPSAGRGARSTALRAGASSRRPSEKKISQYTRSEVWIRKDTYALAQVESYIKSELVRRLKYSDFAQVQGIWTGRRLEMNDLRRNSRTILTLEKLEYNVPLKDEDFTLQALRNPV